MRIRPIMTGTVVALMTAGSLPAAATHDDSMGAFVDESSRIPFVASPTTIATDIELHDHDGDGDLDLFVARGDLSGAPRLAQLFRNTGAGSFSASNLTKVQADFTDIELGNTDGDPRVDIVLSVNLGKERLFVGSASAKSGGIGFVDRSAARMPAAQPLDVTIESQLFDADGDGDLDIIAANEDPFVGPGAQNRLSLNDGTGVFTDHTENLPVILDDSSAFAIGDFDADADRDVITVNEGRFVYLDNDGSGVFTNQTGSRLPSQPNNMNSGRDAIVGDLDADGDLDVMFAISRTDLGPVLWLNDGTGVFSDVSTTNVPLAVNATQDLEACDLDDDGDLDVIEANAGPVLNPPTDHVFAGAQNRILVNDGNAMFTDVTSSHLPPVVDQSFSVACGDINRDGLRDLVVANGKAELMRVYVQQPIP